MASQSAAVKQKQARPEQAAFPTPLASFDHPRALVQRFKRLYEDMATTRQAVGMSAAVGQDSRDLEEGADIPASLEDVYSDFIVLRDPLHEIHGLDALRDYFKSMYANVTDCRFIYHDEWIGEDNAVIKWDMVFTHRRLGRGKEITVRGMSHICFSDRVDYHEDVFDAGAMVYQHVPLMGRGIRWLKSRLA